MKKIDKEHIEHPAKGVVGMTDFLLENNFIVGLRKVRRLMRLMGIQAVYSRFIVGWSLHNSLDTSNCVDVLKSAITRHGTPEIINSDQGCQFTSKEWTDACSQHPEMKVSMDGRGRAKDNIWIERFWKTIKYEYIYIQPEENGTDLFFGIKRFIDDYNYHRRHQGINHTVPSKLYIRQVAWH